MYYAYHPGSEKPIVILAPKRNPDFYNSIATHLGSPEKIVERLSTTGSENLAGMNLFLEAEINACHNWPKGHIRTKHVYYALIKRKRIKLGIIGLLLLAKCVKKVNLYFWYRSADYPENLFKLDENSYTDNDSPIAEYHFLIVRSEEANPLLLPVNCLQRSDDLSEVKEETCRNKIETLFADNIDESSFKKNIESIIAEQRWCRSIKRKQDYFLLYTRIYYLNKSIFTRLKHNQRTLFCEEDAKEILKKIKLTPSESNYLDYFFKYLCPNTHLLLNTSNSLCVTLLMIIAPLFRGSSVKAHDINLDKIVSLTNKDEVAAVINKSIALENEFPTHNLFLLLNKMKGLNVNSSYSTIVIISWSKKKDYHYALYLNTEIPIYISALSEDIVPIFGQTAINKAYSSDVAQFATTGTFTPVYFANINNMLSILTQREQCRISKDLLFMFGLEFYLTQLVKNSLGKVHALFFCAIIVPLLFYSNTKGKELNEVYFTSICLLLAGVYYFYRKEMRRLSTPKDLIDIISKFDEKATRLSDGFFSRLLDMPTELFSKDLAVVAIARKKESNHAFILTEQHKKDSTQGESLIKKYDFYKHEPEKKDNGDDIKNSRWQFFNTLFQQVSPTQKSNSIQTINDWKGGSSAFKCKFDNFSIIPWVVPKKALRELDEHYEKLRNVKYKQNPSTREIEQDHCHNCFTWCQSLLHAIDIEIPKYRGELAGLMSNIPRFRI